MNLYENILIMIIINNIRDNKKEWKFEKILKI